MGTDSRLSKVLEFLYKTSEYKNFFTKFQVEELITDINKTEVGYHCSLLTEQYSFNEVLELTGSMEEGGNVLYNFFRKFKLNEKGNFSENKKISNNIADDDFFLGIQVEGLSIDYGSEKVIINWRITYHYNE